MTVVTFEVPRRDMELLYFTLSVFQQPRTLFLIFQSLSPVERGGGDGRGFFDVYMI